MNSPARPIVYTDTDIPARRRRDHANALARARGHAAAGRRDYAFHELAMAAHYRHALADWYARHRHCDVVLIDGPAFVNSGGFVLRDKRLELLTEKDGECW